VETNEERHACETNEERHALWKQMKSAMRVETNEEHHAVVEEHHAPR
jgi:hypothetical protein